MLGGGMGWGRGAVDGTATLTTTDGNEQRHSAPAAVQTYLYTHRCAHKFRDATKQKAAARENKHWLFWL